MRGGDIRRPTLSLWDCGHLRTAHTCRGLRQCAVPSVASHVPPTSLPTTLRRHVDMRSPRRVSRCITARDGPGCAFGCLCMCCAQFIVRKRALDGNLDNYLCCQGYLPSKSGPSIVRLSLDGRESPRALLVLVRRRWIVSHFTTEPIIFTDGGHFAQRYKLVFRPPLVPRGTPNWCRSLPCTLDLILDPGRT